jgi:hypothetical protein
MAEERNTHVKLAMAEPLGCLVISWIAFLVSMAMFKQITIDSSVAAISNWVGLILIVLAIISFVNENLLCTMVFGPLGIFFVAFPVMGGAAVWLVSIWLGIILLVDTWLATAQPVRLLPVLLFLAAIL